MVQAVRAAIVAALKPEEMQIQCRIRSSIIQHAYISPSRQHDVVEVESVDYQLAKGLKGHLVAVERHRAPSHLKPESRTSTRQASRKEPENRSKASYWTRASGSFQ